MAGPNDEALNEVIDKSLCDCREEVEILMRYGKHPGIVSLKTVYEESNKVYLVLQLLKGGDLLEYMTKRSMTECEAAAIIKTLATTLAYLHENGVVHRDLKPANILFASEDRTADSVTICDMGFAKQGGRLPEVSTEAKLLVTDMLHISPQRRPTAAQLTKHPWVTSRSAVYVQQQARTPLGAVARTPPAIGEDNLKEMVAATFRAIATSPQVAHLGPVAMSELARRRFRDKALNRVQEEGRNKEF
ncbi:unnamed protein product [Callosobruchus maculatus]|uniref:Protein kinase domain-containing protein n=1 Tax=Callosobruchus maculatus TaxID=64391 RepID=A0A653CYJ6_CALMS|nr:unnamed protein product [Callosobruchus maculatus]